MTLLNKYLLNRFGKFGSSGVANTEAHLAFPLTQTFQAVYKRESCTLGYFQCSAQSWTQIKQFLYSFVPLQELS